MTCTEARTFLQNNLQNNLITAGTPEKHECEYPAGIAAHLQSCAQCRHFIADHAELQRLLNSVRNAAPQVSASLDAAVLANFRRNAERISVTNPVRSSRPFRVTSAWFWRGAVAAVVLLAALSLTLRSRAPKHQAQTAKPTLPQTKQPEITARVAQNVATSKAVSAPHRHTKPQPVAPAAALPALARDNFPPGFTSLMYCDPLSCNSPMDIIRMQLPTSSSAPSSPTGFTYADVLVGSDGVARGIRIVQ